MKMTGEPIHFPTAEEWRTWLEANAAIEEDVWLMISKKHAGTPSITLQEAMQEAICFGWIDSQMQPIDEERYALRFTPRRKTSNWSERNKGWGREAHRRRTDDGGRAREDRGSQAERPVGSGLTEGRFISRVRWVAFKGSTIPFPIPPTLWLSCSEARAARPSQDRYQQRPQAAGTPARTRARFRAALRGSSVTRRRPPLRRSRPRPPRGTRPA
jgi:hypothetical protein